MAPIMLTLGMDQRFGPRLAVVLVALFGCSLRELDDFRATGGAATGGSGASGATGPGGAGGSGVECAALDLCNPPIELYEADDPGAGAAGGGGTAARDHYYALSNSSSLVFGDKDDCRTGYSGTKTMIACKAQVGTRFYGEILQGQFFMVMVTSCDPAQAGCTENGSCMGSAPGTLTVDFYQDEGGAGGAGGCAQEGMEPVVFVFMRFEQGIERFAVDAPGQGVDYPTNFLMGAGTFADTMAELDQLDGPAPNCECERETGNTMPQ